MEYTSRKHLMVILVLILVVVTIACKSSSITGKAVSDIGNKDYIKETKSDSAKKLADESSLIKSTAKAEDKPKTCEENIKELEELIDKTKYLMLKVDSNMSKISREMQYLKDKEEKADEYEERLDRLEELSDNRKEISSELARSEDALDILKSKCGPKSKLEGIKPF